MQLPAFLAFVVRCALQLEMTSPQTVVAQSVCLTTTIHGSFDNDLNFLQAYKGCLHAPHTVQEVSTLVLTYNPTCAGFLLGTVGEWRF